MLSDLLSGLELIKPYSPDSPVVTSPYIVTVPAVLQADMSGDDQTAIEALGWLLHPVYLSYYYPAQTITELANVTGEGADEFIMPMVPVPPPILPPGTN